MARYKHVDMSPRLLPVDLEAQLVPGTFAHALHHLIDELDLLAFDTHYDCLGVRAGALHPRQGGADRPGDVRHRWRQAALQCIEASFRHARGVPRSGRLSSTRTLAPRAATRARTLCLARRGSIRRRAAHEARGGPRMRSLRHAARAPSRAPRVRAIAPVRGDGARFPEGRYQCLAANRRTGSANSRRSWSASQGKTE
jgi:hypothetical protein